MKYLKLFENWNTVEDEKLRDELIKITDDYLAFLKDENVTIGFARSSYPNIGESLPKRVKEIMYSTRRPYVYMVIDFKKSNTPMTWEDVKDTIIPYFEYIGNNYKLQKRGISTINKPTKEFDINFDTGNENEELVKVEVNLDELLTPEFNDQKFEGVSINDCYPSVIRTRIIL